MKVLYLNHEQLNPGHEPEFNINDEWFDLCVVNRFPEHYKDFVREEKQYIRNYTSPEDGDEWAKGNCVIYKQKPDDFEFSNYNLNRKYSLFVSVSRGKSPNKPSLIY